MKQVKSQIYPLRVVQHYLSCRDRGMPHEFAELKIEMCHIHRTIGHRVSVHFIGI